MWGLMGWEALKMWGRDVKRIERLTGGVANDVWSVDVDGVLAVARLGNRSDEDLAWETDLLLYLYQKGMIVPLPLPCKNGKLFHKGLVVMSHIKGTAPETEQHWKEVARTLFMVHELTTNFKQRPGWSSSIDLLSLDRGTKVDLRRMPPKGVKKCRAAWDKMRGEKMSVVHGDPNPRNILMTEKGVGLIDWDEAHVDVCLLDLVLPFNAAGLDDKVYDRAFQASAAWEAAVCWDDEFAIKRLSQVREV